MLIVWDLGISSLVLVISLVVPLIALFIRRKWRLAAQRRDEIRRLLIRASEEAARAELEASVDVHSVSASYGFHCPVCYCPATTRCSQCKAVRYCSGKCQIIHWRQGHKEECRPARIIYNTDDEKSVSGLKFREDEENIRDETLLQHAKPVALPISESIFSKTASSTEGVNEDTAENEDLPVIDKEEAVSIADTSGSSFSGFSSSPFNDSCGEISLCESFSSSDSERPESPLEAHVAVELEETCFSTNDDAPSKPLSPKFVHLVDSVDSLASFANLSLQKTGGDPEQNKSRSSSLHSSVTDRYQGSAEPSPMKSSDFWGMALESERVRENCDSSKSGGIGKDTNSAQYFSFDSSRETSADLVNKISDHMSSISEKAPRSALGSVNFLSEVTVTEKTAKSSEKAKISLSTSPTTEVPNPLDTTVLPPLTIQKSKNSSSKTGCILGPSKVEEVQLLAAKVSNTSECADVLKHSPLGAKSGRVLDNQKQNSVAFHRTNLHGKNSLKASVLKVVDQWARPKSSTDNGIVRRHGHKGIFPYELFAKLYNSKKVEFEPCGLINCGNSCFANVVFQCLMFTPPLTTYFLQQFHSRTCPGKEQCFTCGFENLVLKAKEGTSAPLSPSGLLSLLQNIGIFLGNGKQEDAHEFLRFVVDTMQSVCIKASECDMLKATKLEDTTLIGLTFGGYLRSKIRCMKCQGKSEQRERIMDLTVEIDGDISTLDDALRRFTRTEILDGQNKYRCSSCKSYEKAKKKLKITEPPNVLTIALKRFQSGKFGKLNKLIRFPETLDLAPYVSGGSEKSHDYKLYGVIVHLDVMNAAFSGHYVCYIKNSQNKWYKADDSTVVTSEVERVLTKGAYMLFYARCSPVPPRSVCTKTEPSNKKSSISAPKTNGKTTTPLPQSTSISSSNTPGDRASNIQSFYSSFQRLQRILEDDSSSDSSSLFDSNSDECSCSTDSTRDSTSMDDFADFIFGDHGRGGHGHSHSSEAPSPTSSTSSSPLFTRHSPLGESSRCSPETNGTSRHEWQENIKDAGKQQILQDRQVGEGKGKSEFFAASSTKLK